MEEKKMFSGGMFPLLQHLTMSELNALVDFQNSTYYDIFVKIRKTWQEILLEEIKGNVDYQNAALTIKYWQTIENYWDSILTLSLAASKMVDIKKEKKS